MNDVTLQKEHIIGISFILFAKYKHAVNLAKCLRAGIYASVHLLFQAFKLTLSKYTHKNQKHFISQYICYRPLSCADSIQFLCSM